MTTDRARKRAARTLADAEGCSYTEALRRLANRSTSRHPHEGRTAERDWSRHARVRILADVHKSAPTGRPVTYRAGQELQMHQNGRRGRAIDSDWWTSSDIDGAHIFDPDEVEAVEELTSPSSAPFFAGAALDTGELAELFGDIARDWRAQGVIVVRGLGDWEVRRSDGDHELLGRIESRYDHAQGRYIVAENAQYRVTLPGRDDDYERHAAISSGPLPQEPAAVTAFVRTNATIYGVKDRRSTPTSPAGVRRHAVPLAIALTVPEDTALTTAGQAIADAVRELHRVDTGERYAARADVVLPHDGEQVTDAELQIAGAQIAGGYRLLVVVALDWARRAWTEEETSAVIADTYMAVRAMCVECWPDAAPPIGVPADTPAVLGAAWRGQVLCTSDADPTLVPDILLL